MSIIPKNAASTPSVRFPRNFFQGGRGARTQGGCGRDFCCARMRKIVLRQAGASPRRRLCASTERAGKRHRRKGREERSRMSTACRIGGAGEDRPRSRSRKGRRWGGGGRRGGGAKRGFFRGSGMILKTEKKDRVGNGLFAVCPESDYPGFFGSLFPGFGSL